MSGIEATIDWALKILIGVGFLGLAVWAVRQAIIARTTQHKASDQPITLGELQAHCKGEHETLEKELKAEVAHVRELIEKDLEHGRKKFDALFKAVDNTNKLVTAFTQNLTAEVVKAVKSANGGP